MSHDTDITEVSDPRDMTIDALPAAAVDVIKIVKGEPTTEETRRAGRGAERRRRWAG